MVSCSGGSNTFGNQCPMFKLKCKIIQSEFSCIPLKEPKIQFLLISLAWDELPNVLQLMFFYFCDKSSIKTLRAGSSLSLLITELNSTLLLFTCCCLSCELAEFEKKDDECVGVGGPGANIWQLWEQKLTACRRWWVAGGCLRSVRV